MADKKLSELTALTGANTAAGDLLYIVDVSEPVAADQSKKITLTEFQVAPVSSGTANGVLFLNASKVQTSGTAITFDGTNFATTGTASATKLIPTGNVVAGNGMYLPAANTLAWSTGGVERLRITSAGDVGIGTNAPTVRLDVVASGANVTIASMAGVAGRGLTIATDSASNGRTDCFVKFNAGDSIGQYAFLTATTERLRITSGGSLVLGNGETAASPTSSTLQATGGSGTNITGASLTIQGGRGTGTGPGGPIIFSTSAAGTTGTTLNAATERARIDSAGNTLIGTTTNTNSSRLVVNGTISETVGSTQYLVASQYDVGTAANQIPLNQYLGALAYIDSQFSAPQVGAGITTGTGTICTTSFGVEGTVKVMRIVIDLTGLNSGGTAGDIIGVNGTALPCFIAQIPSTYTVLGGRMTCLETPAGGDTDIDLYSATEGTGVEDQAITALTETEIINAGAQTIGTVTFFSADPAANAYFYLVGQSTSNATYTAGRFLIEIFGA
jgi:hypothetical protein